MEKEKRQKEKSLTYSGVISEALVDVATLIWVGVAITAYIDNQFNGVYQHAVTIGLGIFWIGTLLSLVNRRK